MRTAREGAVENLGRSGIEYHDEAEGDKGQYAQKKKETGLAHRTPLSTNAQLVAWFQLTRFFFIESIQFEQFIDFHVVLYSNRPRVIAIFDDIVFRFA